MTVIKNVFSIRRLAAVIGRYSNLPCPATRRGKYTINLNHNLISHSSPFNVKKKTLFTLFTAKFPPNPARPDGFRRRLSRNLIGVIDIFQPLSPTFLLAGGAVDDIYVIGGGRIGSGPGRPAKRKKAGGGAKAPINSRRDALKRG
jgi:hypothetical protein